MHLLQENKLKFITVFFILLYSAQIWGTPLPASELIEKFKQNDGKEIEFIGEAFGDKMIRADGVWVNILDTTGTALGVWMQHADAEKIKYIGSYNYKGDIVKITGIFNRACKLHKGELDIHAISCQITQTGMSIKHEISIFRLALSIILFAIAIILIILWRRVFIHKIKSTDKIFN
ncbi:DNA-binding protein [Candidatus Poribacteria bacterium]|nr:DNA-binding protein [Candidatus Poribacteria bacterium]